MQVLIGFVIALAVGLTGVGGGSFTTPALVLLAGISGAEAVGTALVFSTIIRLLAAPFYLVGKQINPRYLGLMLAGAIPGLLVGTYLLRMANARLSNPFVLVVIGAMLVGSAVLTAFHFKRRVVPVAGRASWLAWLSLPIGIETGFSSAGAGALGTLLLFNFSEMTATQVVGTDLMFGIALAFLGSLFHIGLGTINMGVLQSLLIGGVPGVLLGCMLSRRVPAQRLRYGILALTMLLGFQLLFTGGKSIFGSSVAAKAVQTPAVASGIR
jgi:uncharacterized membrane protein YfcA